MAEDSDNQDGEDMLNYKGIYAGEEKNDKYTCPVTGAHFHFKDMCRRMNHLIKWRKVYDQKLATYALIGHTFPGITQVTVHPEEVCVLNA